jgi:hypothetical protein
MMVNKKAEKRNMRKRSLEWWGLNEKRANYKKRG